MMRFLSLLLVSAIAFASASAPGELYAAEDGTGLEGAEFGLDEEFYSRKKRVRVTDGVGKGRNKEIALQNAIIDARKKAISRVTSSFRFVYTESNSGEFGRRTIAQEVNAKIIERERIIRVKYEHDLDFSPYVFAVADVIITVSFLDLDFFAEEIMKTAEAACIRSIVLSGWGQVFNRSYYSGIMMGLVTYGALGYGVYRNSEIAPTRNAYNNATTSVEAERYFKQLRSHQVASTSLYVIGFATWAYSVWEAFEDRERADEVLDKVHDLYFPRFPYERRFSPIQRFMLQDLRPKW